MVRRPTLADVASATGVSTAPVSYVLAQHQVWLGILGGALTYLAVIVATGGLRKDDLARLLRRG